jgi:hypothetical protein
MGKLIYLPKPPYREITSEDIIRLCQRLAVREPMAPEPYWRAKEVVRGVVAGLVVVGVGFVIWMLTN